MHYLLSLCLALGSSGAQAPALLPAPRSVELADGVLDLDQDLRIHLEDDALRAHALAFAETWWRLTGARPVLVAAGDGALSLGLDPTLQPEEYRLEIDRTIRVRGGSPTGVAHGTATLLQLARRGEAGWQLPRVTIEDAPAAPFRAVMLDVARHPHQPETLRGVIDLLYLYKLRYLHLHLTDDQAFTFPFAPVTEALEEDATLPLETWRELVLYGDARGVTLVPELDLPGHSRPIKRSGYLVDPTPDDGMSDADVAHPANHARLFRIVDAMCDVFRSSPYFHIGGDESGAGEALVPFLAAANAHLRARSDPRRLLVWEGFRGHPVELPATGDDRIVVLSWESAYNPPWSLLDAGYQVVNASWKPLYVVGGGAPRLPHVGGRRWSARDIHRWSKDQFWHWQAGTPVFEDRGPGDDNPDDGIWHVPAEQRDQVLGGQLLFWEQRDRTVLRDAWDRVAALSDRLWSGAPRGGHAASDYAGFRRRHGAVAERVQRLVQPARIALAGAVDTESPVAYDFHWFNGPLVASVDVEPSLGGEVRVTRDGSPPSPASERYVAPLSITGPTELRARLFVDGAPVGAGARALLDDRPARVWASWFDLPRRALAYVPDFSDRTRWRPYLTGLLPELRGPYRTSEPVGQHLVGTLVVPAGEAGEHTFRIQTRDGRARLYLDGEALLGPTAPSEVKLSATVDLAAGPHEVRVDHASGPISPVLLVAVKRPGDADFREITPLLAEIPRGTEPLHLVSLREPVDLLAGGSLAAWHLVTEGESSPPGDLVRLDDEGVLHIAGDPRGYLVTERWYRDYSLELDWRWPPGSQPGNSGVLVHVTTPLLFYGWPRSLEVQLQAGSAGDFWLIGDDVDLTLEDDAARRTPRRPGDLHGHRRLPRRVADLEAPVGTWNHLRVVCDGDEVIVHVNGVETNRGIDGTLSEGGIALQSEGAAIEFRRVRLAPLPLRVR